MSEARTLKDEIKFVQKMLRNFSKIEQESIAFSFTGSFIKLQLYEPENLIMQSNQGLSEHIGDTCIYVSSLNSNLKSNLDINTKSNSTKKSFSKKVLKSFSDKPKNSAKIQILEYVWMLPPTRDSYTNELGKDFFDRCAEKLNAWVGADPTPERIRKGQNAGHTFRSWVINAVAKEKAEATKLAPKKSQQEKNLEMLFGKDAPC